jgi:hypothetical protein
LSDGSSPRDGFHECRSACLRCGRSAASTDTTTHPAVLVPQSASASAAA